MPTNNHSDRQYLVSAENEDPPTYQDATAQGNDHFFLSFKLKQWFSRKFLRNIHQSITYHSCSRQPSPNACSHRPWWMSKLSSM